MPHLHGGQNTRAAYLAWLGLGLVRAALGAWRQRAGTGPVRSPRRAAAAQCQPIPASAIRCRTAFVISLMNPKAILFFVSFFIQFVDPDYPQPALSPSCCSG